MALPPHWIGDTWPSAWASSDLDGEDGDLPELDLQRVGNVFLPREFFLVLSDGEDDEPSGLIITFEAANGELYLRTIQSSNTDIGEWMNRTASQFPMSAWKSYAKSKMVWVLSQDEVRSRMPNLINRDGVPARPRQASLGADSGTSSSRRTRHRITEEHLKEVVRIYSEASERGEAPTRTVAEVFDVAHSTAAKWVGTARRNGLLEGVSQKWGTKKE